MINLLFGDCLEVLPTIPDQSIDMVLVDPPYGTTACKWDSVMPFDHMWSQVWRVLKPPGTAVFTASQPFTSRLVMSCPDRFKYSMVWSKSRGTGFQDAKRRPLKFHEDIIVFSAAGCSTGSSIPMQYYPRGLVASGRVKTLSTKGRYMHSGSVSGVTSVISSHTNYPRSVVCIGSQGKSEHPTQKPVELMQHLIELHTEPGQVVLDFAMGSGTTGVSCVRSERSFIGIENNQEYFKIAERRIAEAVAEQQNIKEE